MNYGFAVRAALLQGVLLTGVAFTLGSLLEREFFVSWGAIAGPGVWAACALAVAALLRLPLAWVLLGAGLSGLPSLAAVLSGVHWAGAPLAVLLFGAWCGWLAHRLESSRTVPPGGIEPPLPA